MRFPERIHPAADPLIFREKLFKQTEPLLTSLHSQGQTENTHIYFAPMTKLYKMTSETNL